MKTDNIEDIYELTPLQKGLLFHSLYATELSLYFFHHVFTLKGELNLDAFERAWQQVVNRHTVLRTAFYWEDIDNPLQVVHKQVKITLNRYDWRELDTNTQQKRLESFLEQDRSLSFDFARPCLMRLTLIRLADDNYQFIWSNHHIILDGWSFPIVLQECLQIYTAICEQKAIDLPPTRPFRDYLDWLQQQDISKTETFWRRALQGVKTATSLKNLTTIQELNSSEERYNEERIKLSAETVRQLQSIARQNRLTFATLFHGVWAILLSRYACNNDIVYGCTVTGRPVDLPNADCIVGVFINTLPIHVKVNPQESLSSWLQSFQSQLAEIRHYEHTPLTEIQGWSEIPRNLPLFNSFVVVENQPASQFLKDWQGNIEFQETGEYYLTNYPLGLVVYPDTETIVGISYNSSLFELATIQGILNQVKILLQNIIDNTNVSIEDLSFLTEKQQQTAMEMSKDFSFDFALAKNY